MNTQMYMSISFLSPFFTWVRLILWPWRNKTRWMLLRVGAIGHRQEGSVYWGQILPTGLFWGQGSQILYKGHCPKNHVRNSAKVLSPHHQQKLCHHWTLGGNPGSVPSFHAWLFHSFLPAQSRDMCASLMTLVLAPIKMKIFCRYLCNQSLPYAPSSAFLLGSLWNWHTFAL